MDHPNIVRIHDVEATDQGHFLVTEFVDGPNLEALVEARGPLDPVRAAQYVRQAADALQAAHEAGMVHRDVKPSNFLVDRSGTVKLLDLGLVKLLRADDGLTRSLDGKAVLGTIDFQAPEQAVDSSDVDIRADIYGLGATFYFLLTGQVIFPEGTVAQKLSWHQRRKPQPLREVRPEVPEKMAKIVAKMLAKDPKHRYQTPEEVAAALESWTRDPVQPLEEFELPKVSKAARAFLSAWSNQRRTNTPQGRERPRPKTPPMTPLPEDWKARILKARDWPRTRVLMLGGGALALLLATVGYWWWNNQRGDQSTPVGTSGPRPAVQPGPEVVANPQPQPQPQPAAVPSQPGNPPAASTFAVVGKTGLARPAGSLKEALAESRPGDRIEVRAAEVSESLEWSAHFGVDLVGVSPAGGPVVWRAPEGLPSERPLLEIKGTEGSSVRGFKFDGQGRMADLLRVSGPTPDLTLEDLEFSGAARGLTLHAASGAQDHPITLRGLRFQGQSGCGLRLETTSADPAAAVRSARVRLCRFEGPCPTAIEVDGPTNDVEVRECRFFQVAAGVRFTRAASTGAINITVEGNTFARVDRGLSFEAAPTTSNLVVKNNLFFYVPKLALVDGLVLLPPDAPEPDAWIWTSESKPGSTVVPPGARPFRKTFDLTAAPTKATLEVGADETFEVWVNGQSVGKSQAEHFDQRVFAFDVTNLLRPGRNVVAVLAGNKADPFNPGGYGTTAGLMTRVRAKTSGGDKVVAQADASWKTTPSAPPEGWQKPEFDDAAWPPARPWSEAKIVGVTWPWVQTVWDDTVLAQQKSPPGPLKITASGNVRDYHSWEGHPNLEAARAFLKDDFLPIKASDDKHFLRYAKNSPLAKGASGEVIGLPEAE